MFHLGILMVIADHVVGLLIPREWLYAIGISEEIYHFGATTMGTAAAVLTLAGFQTIVIGTLATVVYQVFGSGFHYRETISPWIRSLLFFQPQPELMEHVPLLFQLHVLTAFALFILWPFTRLVHVFSAPVGYLFRPYIVYRSRDEGRGNRPVRRGWDPVQAPDPERLHKL